MGTITEVMRRNAMSAWRERQYANVSEFVIRIPSDDEISDFMRQQYDEQRVAATGAEK